MTVLENRLRKRLITRYGGVLELPAAARLVAVWADSQAGELVARQGLVPGAVLPAAWGPEIGS